MALNPAISGLAKADVIAQQERDERNGKKDGKIESVWIQQLIQNYFLIPKYIPFVYFFQ